jgi:hypothetical protein
MALFQLYFHHFAHTMRTPFREILALVDHGHCLLVLRAAPQKCVIGHRGFLLFDRADAVAAILWASTRAQVAK